MNIYLIFEWKVSTKEKCVYGVFSTHKRARQEVNKLYKMDKDSGESDTAFTIHEYEVEE